MFVAEIGLNHKGNEKRAFQMLKDLIATDIDAMTFQITEPAFYEKNKKWGKALSQDFYKKAINFAHQNNKLIGFAIKDKDMIDFLDTAGADFWKTLSGSMRDADLLAQLQKTKKNMFVSTGFSSEEEIISVGKKLKNATFIHTQLSQKLEDSNLKAILRLRNVTKKNVAFGLHAADHQVLYLSVAFEPKDVFFYVKDSINEKFPDEKHAIMIGDVNTIVNLMKRLKGAMGNGVKKGAENKIR